MSRETLIQWCDSTVNPTMGCDGCELWNPKRKSCYAGMITTYKTGKGLLPGWPPNFDTPTLFPGRMAKAARWRDLRGVPRPDKPWMPPELPRLVFISDMSDALSKSVPFDYLKAEIIDVVGGWPHIGLWLTKQPRRMAEFSGWLRGQGIPWPRNLWPGASITTPGTLWRIDELLNVGDASTIRFLSVEPMLERIAFKFPTPDPERDPAGHRIHWAIFGGESGNDHRPFNLDDLHHGIQQCRATGVRVFVKQLGAQPHYHAINPSQPAEPIQLRAWPLKLDPKHGGDWSEWPPHLRLREFPFVPPLSK